MLDVEPPSSIVDLSRNASTISTSSSSSAASSVLGPPVRPVRPIRPFSAPRRSRSRDPQSPSTPRNSSRPPAFLTRDLTVSDNAPAEQQAQTPLSRSRQNSLGGAAKISIHDFDIDRNPLGEGSYSEVLKAVHRTTNKVYAIKVVDKKLLLRENKAATAHAEKNSLNKLGAGKGHPGVIRLYWTFQDDWSLYFVLDLAPNGDLQGIIQRLGSLSLRCTRFYMGQVLDALQWMHRKGVLHRDMKPENVLLDSDMRVKITDFGTSKNFDEKDASFRAKTWVGTAQYIAPELIIETYTCKSSDIWAWGCMTFQCIAGRFPFVAKTQYLMWEKVKQLDYEFPEGFDVEGKDLVEQILKLEPSSRLGAGSEEDLKLGPSALRRHPFFTSLQWPTIWTDPVPDLEVGMFKRDPSEAGEASFDAGAAWDALVLGDEIPWVGTDQESRIPLEFAAQAKQSTTPGVSLDESAISEESGPPPIHRQSSSHDEIADKLHEFSLQPHIFPKQARGSFSTSGSNTVSQDSSSSEPTSKDDVPAVVKSGSREELLAPYLASLSPTETVVLSTSVVPRPTFRQRASSIISVSPIKLPAPPIKRRQLVLTSERLLCLKLKDGRPPTIKAEIPLTTKHLLVERKSEKEFTVVAGKTYTYAVEDSALVNRWTEQIRDAMDAHRGRRVTRH